jgi:hypothetical protein
MTYYEVLYQHLSGEIQENCKSQGRLLWLRFKLGNSIIWNRCANHYTMMFSNMEGKKVRTHFTESHALELDITSHIMCV